ncbi:MAG: helix-turn-helix transcriptional regulator [Rikenellaceae bacterium]
MNNHSGRVPVIAILAANSLMGVGLQAILEQMLPFAAFKICDSFDDIAQSAPEELFHIFVAAHIVVKNGEFFGNAGRKNKTIVLTNGTANAQLLDSYKQINISQSPEQIKGAIEQMHSHAHRAKKVESESDEKSLSSREIEVLKLVVEGLINKEIADRLNISVSTVITHRKNIVEKLGVRSVAGLTIYAVMKRFVEI